MHVVNSSVQEALIGTELLRRTHTSACANNGHEISLLHLLVHELLQGVAHTGGVFERETEIIDHQHDGALDLRRRQMSGGGGGLTGGRGTDIAGGVFVPICEDRRSPVLT